MQRERMREIQLAADEFREGCEVLRYGIANLFGECERRGYRMIRYPVGTDGALGFAQLREGEKIIFTNSSVRLARELFSAAHEAGHMLLHMKGEQHFYLDNEETFNRNTADCYEQEANYFAACLLMPEAEVARYIHLVMNDKPADAWSAFDIARMMTAFQVSFDMTINRLQNLKYIKGAVRKRLDSEKNEIRVSNLLKMIGGNSRLNAATYEKQIPGEYMTWVIDNYNHGVIPQETLKRALRYFELTLEDVRDDLHRIDEPDDELEELVGVMDE